MKYIVVGFEHGGVKREYPFSFPDMIIHSDMFSSIRHLFMIHHKIEIKIISGGFCNMYECEICCNGKSESLKVKSRDGIDSELFRMFNYEHGIVF